MEESHWRLQRIVMDELATIRRDMAGLRREFAKFRSRFRKLQVEFIVHAHDIQANWERADRLMSVHMRDMEEFHNSRQQRLARQDCTGGGTNPRQKGGFDGKALAGSERTAAS